MTTRYSPFDAAFEAMVREAVLQLWGDLPGRPELDFGDFFEIRFEGWSAGLFWGDTGMGESNSRALSVIAGSSTSAPTPELAASVAEAAFGSTIATMRRRHGAAIALGLVENGSFRDLEPARILVDRTLIRILDETGLDLRGCAQRMCGPDTRKGKDDYFQCLVAEFEDGYVYIEETDEGRPKISTSVDIGDASYNGRSLSIPTALPQIVCDTVSGRNLGSIVETGREELDRRIVSHVNLYEVDDFFRTSVVHSKVFLLPDDVELGPLAAPRRA